MIFIICALFGASSKEKKDYVCPVGCYCVTGFTCYYKIEINGYPNVGNKLEARVFDISPEDQGDITESEFVKFQWLKCTDPNFCELDNELGTNNSEILTDQMTYIYLRVYYKMTYIFYSPVIGPILPANSICIPGQGDNLIGTCYTVEIDKSVSLNLGNTIKAIFKSDEADSEQSIGTDKVSYKWLACTLQDEIYSCDETNLLGSEPTLTLKESDTDPRFGAGSYIKLQVSGLPSEEGQTSDFSGLTQSAEIGPILPANSICIPDQNGNLIGTCYTVEIDKSVSLNLGNTIKAFFKSDEADSEQSIGTDKVSYKWLACTLQDEVYSCDETNLLGSEPTLTLKESDTNPKFGAGSYIKLQVSGLSSEEGQTSDFSGLTQSVEIGPILPANSICPTDQIKNCYQIEISGALVIENKITATFTDLNDLSDEDLQNIEFKWFKCTKTTEMNCDSTPFATGKTCILQSNIVDSNYYIKLVASGKNTFSGTSEFINEESPVKPSLTVSIAETSPKVGSTIHAKVINNLDENTATNELTDNINTKYKWEILDTNPTELKGDGNSLYLDKKTEGKKIKVTATYTSSEGQKFVQEYETTVLSGLSVEITFTGKLRLGTKLSATTEIENDDTASSKATYKWEAVSVGDDATYEEINNDDSTPYLLTIQDDNNDLIGKFIKVTVTGKDGTDYANLKAFDQTEKVVCGKGEIDDGTHKCKPEGGSICKIPNCDRCGPDNNCAKCANGYDLNKENGQCDERPSHCDDVVLHCSMCNEKMPKLCVTCNENYGLSNGICTYCPNEYENGICRPSCSLLENCENCSLTNNRLECTKCSENYTVGAERQCVLIKDLPEDYCKKYSSSCTKCDPDDHSICINCTNGFDLIEGKCICLSDNTEYEGKCYNSTETTCSDLKSQHCLKCVNSNQCIQCETGFGLFKGVCTELNCSQVSNCDTEKTSCNYVNDQLICLNCEIGYELFNGECIELILPVFPNEEEVQRIPIDDSMYHTIDNDPKKIEIEKPGEVDNVYFSLDVNNDDFNSISIPSKTDVLLNLNGARTDPLKIESTSDSNVTVEFREGSSIQIPPSSGNVNLKGKGNIKINHIIGQEKNDITINEVVPDPSGEIVIEPTTNLIINKIQSFGETKLSGRKDGNSITCNDLSIEGGSSFTSDYINLKNVQIGIKSVLNMKSHNTNFVKGSKILIYFNRTFNERRFPIVISSIDNRFPNFANTHISVVKYETNKMLPEIKEEDKLLVAQFNEGDKEKMSEECMNLIKIFQTGEFGNPKCINVSDTEVDLVVERIVKQPTPTKNRLTGGAIAGIVIACVVVAAAIIALIVYFFVIKKKNQSSSSVQEVSSIVV